MSLSPSQTAQARHMLGTLRRGTCTIGPETASVDPDTLETTITPGSEHYAGSFKLRTASTATSERDAGGQIIVAQGSTLSLPVDEASDVRIGDIMIIGAVDSDPDLVGMRLRIAGIHPQTSATARRYPVEVLS